MFMVDDIETATLKPVHYPRHFENESAVWRKQFGHIADEAI
jgi:hypothetical protein